MASTVPCPLVFVSAAEAAWPADAPLVPPFLAQYLTAKRAVERYLLDAHQAGACLMISRMGIDLLCVQTWHATIPQRRGKGTRVHAGRLRSTILRPSLVWTPARLGAVAPVLGFTLANQLGIPGIDKPVRVETLAKAAVAALLEGEAWGIWGYRDMEEAAARLS